MSLQVQCRVWHKVNFYVEFKLNIKIWIRSFLSGQVGLGVSFWTSWIRSFFLDKLD